MTVTVKGEETIRAAFDALVSNTDKEVAEALLAGGLDVETTAKESIQLQSPGTERKRYRANGTHEGPRGGKYTPVIAAAPGFPPNRDQGDLAKSIVTLPRKDHVVVGVVAGDMVARANWLEYGTSRMAARPFLIPAFKKNIPGILDKIAKATARAALLAQEGKRSE
jgi:HK97 gp10 family phage protein